VRDYTDFVSISIKKTSSAAGLLAGVLCIVGISAANATAATITGTDVTITSSFDGGPIESTTVTVGTPDTLGASKEVTSPTFSWMSANDYVDLYFIPESGFNVLHVSFDASDSFLSTDDIAMSLTLAPTWEFGAAALTQAIDVTVPTAGITGDTLSFDIQGLHQIPDNGGHLEYTFDAVATPEPSTLGLIALGGGLFTFLRRRM